MKFEVRSSMVAGMLGAVVALSSVSVPAVLAVTATASAQGQAERMANLKARADAEISRRVTSLNTLISKINANKRLTAAQKQSFVGDINSEISGLTTLKTKIDADTDVNTLKTDVQSIVNTYRVYVLYIPKIHILSADERINDVADKLTTLAAQLNTRIQQDQSAGKNVTSLQSAYTDMLAKIADARKQASNADAAVLPLTPDGYPGNRSQLVAAFGMTKAGVADLRAAYADARTIVTGLKALSMPAGATGSATPATSSAH